jgi:2-oxo-4-hydroxy-4-carboxy--5-ureidoimidazoline (OHCU) decarboxylase
MAQMRSRAGNSREVELGNALAQIGHITRGRLEKMLHG